MVVYVADMDGIGIAFEPLEAARFGMNGVHKFGFGKPLRLLNGYVSVWKIMKFAKLDLTVSWY